MTTSLTALARAWRTWCLLFLLALGMLSVTAPAAFAQQGTDPLTTNASRYCVGDRAAADPICKDPTICKTKGGNTNCQKFGQSCARNPESPECKTADQAINCTNSVLAYCIGKLQVKDPEKLKNINCDVGTPDQKSGTCRRAQFEARGYTSKQFVLVGIDLAGLDVCFPCTLVGQFSKMAYELGGKAYRALQTSVAALLAALFGIYVLVHAGKLLFPFGPLENVAGTFNAVMTRTLVIIAVSTFLLSFANYWRLIHTPPLVAGINLTSAIMDEAKKTLTDGRYIRQTCATVTNATPGAVSTALDCTIRNAQGMVARGLQAAIGTMFSNNWSTNPLIFFNTGLGGIAISIFSAIILLLVYAPLYFAFPIKIADVVLRWTILAILSPLIVAAAAFPVTRSFLFAALKGVMQAALELVLYGIVLAFGAYAIDSVTSVLRTNNGNFATLVNTSLFWQLLLIGWIMDVLLKKARSVAIVMVDPTPNPSGMNAEAIDENAQKAANRINTGGAAAFNWGSKVITSRKT